MNSLQKNDDRVKIKIAVDLLNNLFFPLLIMKTIVITNKIKQITSKLIALKQVIAKYILIAFHIREIFKTLKKSFHMLKIL